jgi:enoyl-CoA hydratase/carnithine racemase
MNEQGEVRLEQSEGLGIIVLSRPQKLNALSPHMRMSLGTCLAQVAQDTSIKLVLIRAEGTDFCTGADLVGAR